MKFNVQTADGKKSIDRKVAKLVRYVNEHVQHMATDEATEWARRTIENGVKNLASYCVAVRVD